MSVQVFCSFLNWIVFLLFTSFWIIVSLFCCFLVVQNFFLLWPTSICLFCFCYLCFWVCIQKIIAYANIIKLFHFDYSYSLVLCLSLQNIWVEFCVWYDPFCKNPFSSCIWIFSFLNTTLLKKLRFPPKEGLKKKKETKYC